MSKLLINEQILCFQPALAMAVGVNEAIFLQQLHYWLEKSKHLKNGRYWVYNTYEQWRAQFPFWSVETLKRIFKSLKEQNIVFIEKLSESKLDHTNWFSINYDELNKLEVIHSPGGNQQIDQVKMTQSENRLEANEINDWRAKPDQVKMTRSNRTKCADLYKVSETTYIDYNNKQPVVVEKNSNEQTASTLANQAGITMFEMAALIDSYGIQEVKTKIQILLKQKNIGSAVGWLRKALDSNFQESIPYSAPEPKQGVRDADETLQYLHSQEKIISTPEGKAKGLKSLRQALGGINAN